MPVHVGDRDVYVNTKGTQTVKVCTDSNTQGQYEKYYRIQPPHVMEPRELEAELGQFATVADMERWLVTDRRAIREQQNEVIVPRRAPGPLDPPTPRPSAGGETVDISIEVKKDGITVGVIKTNRAGVIWMPRGQPSGHQLSWVQLEELARKHGKPVGM